MKPQSRSQSSASSSCLRLISKSKVNDIMNSSNGATISKYVSASTESDDCQSKEITLKKDVAELNEESPYKSSISEIKNSVGNASTNEETDFKTPKRINTETFKIPRNNLKVSKNNTPALSNKPKQVKRGRKPKDSKKSKQVVFTKTIKENFHDTDVNLEHLQVAVALSLSMQDCNKQENKNTNLSLAACSSSQQKVASLRETLKQFGFKQNSGRIEVQNRRAPVERKKKSRCKFITPILFLRSEEDRQTIISDKIATILSQNVYENVYFATFNSDIQVRSDELQKYWRDDSKIFKMGNCKLDNLQNNEFYVRSLNIPKSERKCGSLLRDWSKIPGRETSPECIDRNFIETKITEQEYNCDNGFLSQEASNIDEISLKSRSLLKNKESPTDLNLSNELQKTLTNLQIHSFSDGSVSPELFDSDDEAALKISATLNRENYTKNNNVSSHPIPEENCASEECSESLPDLTPLKKRSRTSEFSINSKMLKSSKKTSPPNQSKKNSSKNKYSLSDLSEDDLFENEKGIYTFESFCNENVCFDLTNSDSEENNKSTCEDMVMDLTHSHVSSTTTNRNTSASPIKTGISEIFQNLSSIKDDEQKEKIQKDDAEITFKRSRRSKSLNITDYICKMLNEEQESVINSSSVQEKCFNAEQINEDQIFDLTQSSDSSCSNHLQSETKDEFVNRKRREKISSSSSCNNQSPVISKKGYNKKLQKHDSFQSTASDEVILSQESTCISDEELNYSSAFSTPCYKVKFQSKPYRKKLCEFFESNDFEQIDLEKASSSNNSDYLNFTSNNSKNEADKNSPNPAVDFGVSELLNNTLETDQLLLQHPRVKNLSKENTPARKALFYGQNNELHDSFHLELKNDSPSTSNTDKNVISEQDNKNTTPKRDVIIKTSNVTPMANYDTMNTPKIIKELQKFGLKPLKRQRGVQILKHIYESTHPLVGETTQNNENSESEEEHRVTKKRKSNKKIKSPKMSQSLKKNKSCKNDSLEKDSEGNSESVNEIFQPAPIQKLEQIEIVGNLMSENDKEEDLIFEKKQSSKIPSCKVPLHIAWFNMVSSDPDLMENILLYEPLQLEVLYANLKEQGYKYHIQDLLTFLDKKCITVRTNQHSSRRRHKKKKSPKKS